MFYVSRGNIPHKRHTQHRAPDGSLYAEELFGVEGFVGRSSLLYHVVPPTRTHRIEAGPAITVEEADDGLHRHRLVKTGGRLVKHARYSWLLLAESQLTRRLFGSMLRRMEALPLPAG